ETLEKLRRAYPGKICPNATGIEVQSVSGYSPRQTGDVIYKSDSVTGFICRNQDQPGKTCNDYRVRFSCHPPFCGGGVCWTEFFNRDDPSVTGDWELLKLLQRENPGKICDHPLFIEAVTSDTNAPAYTTGDTFYRFSPSQGFVCRRRDQRRRFCRDYKVRFGCPCKY
uniref:WxxW domain-containing protein n=1 Tax=Salarias fasciatus TaxID=181472 RepID=A0A672II75_SALFA